MGQNMRLTLNNDFIDRIMDQLKEMKTNHNKLVKLTSPDNQSTIVIEHADRDKIKSKKKE